MTRFTVPPWLGGTLFLAGFLACLTVAARHRDERTAGAHQLLCAAGLMLFYRGARAAGSRWTTAAFTVATLSLALTAVLTWITAATAAHLPAPAVAALVTDTIHLGGAVHVVALGALTGGLATSGRPAPVFRALGVLAAVLACASIVSVVADPATPLLPAGGLLCMVWIIVFAATLLSRADATRHRPDPGGSPDDRPDLPRHPAVPL